MGHTPEFVTCKFMSSLEVILMSAVYLKILLGRPHVDTQIYFFNSFVNWLLSTHVIVIIGDRLYKADLALVFRKGLFCCKI